MPVQIQPIIGTAAQVNDYCGITATQAAATISSGITLASFVGILLNRTAWQIATYLDYDYTTSQVQTLRFNGNDTFFLDLDFPIGTITAFTSFDPTNPSGTTVDETTAVVAARDTSNPYRLYRIDGKTFASPRQYYLAFTQAADLNNPNGWPFDVVQVQMEMIDTIIKESANSADLLGQAEEENSVGKPLKLVSLDMRWKDRLRPYRKIQI